MWLVMFAESGNLYLFAVTLHVQVLLKLSLLNNQYCKITIS